MITHKPVVIPNNAFIFCRYSLAILLWLALIFKIRFLLVLAALIFILSYILKIQNAPMIIIYKYTLGNLLKSGDIILDESAMRFAHGFAAVLSLVCLALLFSPAEPAGWTFLALFAVLKTVSALGFCPASKLFSCLTSGSACCRFKGAAKC